MSIPTLILKKIESDIHSLSHEAYKEHINSTWMTTRYMKLYLLQDYAKATLMGKNT